ncbi:hypothetical protein BH11MYX2_BH11MYX2_13680 [soil metagenome]
MKKCLSCTKDLPDAALHCVFCGAKQAPAPASSPALGKTVMGHGGHNEELQKLRAHAVAQNAGRVAAPASSPPANLPSASPYNAPRAANPSSPPPTSGYAPGNLAPIAGANAPTMAFSGPPPGMEARPHSPSQPMPMGSGPSAPLHSQPQSIGQAPRPHSPSSHPMPAGVYAPVQVATPPPVAPMPIGGFNQTQPQGDPYARDNAPVEPWKNSLRTQMFIWGGLILVAFALPTSTDGLSFRWDAILHGEGVQKLGPLVIAAVGLLSILVGAIPMAPAARGTIALLLGLAGVFVPVFAGNIPGWEFFLPIVGVILVTTGLLARSEYRASAAPRIVTTLGVLAALFLFVVPLHGGSPPIVHLFDGFGQGGAAGIIMQSLVILWVLFFVLALLVWLPASSSGMGKPLAWAIILWPFVITAAALFLIGNPSDITSSPAAGAQWVIGADGGKGTYFIGAGYLVLISYGAASVLGKSLE